ncbi:acyl-CoA dehydrogenase family protein [Novosphingobium sp.]|uniref:acyl-CoA dehydrogenase family protein n=1 Tax=Novosphingobium sp. TaxID=1874826 RepID=UPI0025E88733|nr:acyl-CoA dehydrogenase family protein [Novosphingobium sp.]
MDLSLTSDQIAILDALDGMVRPYAAMPIGATGFALTSADLDREIGESGFLDVGRDPDLGAVTAALVVERLARLPFATEAAVSALIGPLLGEGTGGPLCVVDAARLHRPLRFLAPGATVVVLGDAVTSFTAAADQVRAEPESLFAYPMGTLLVDPSTALATRHDISPDHVRTHLRIALAAEAAGLLSAALEVTCTYLADRQQFGRPLATFQALRHRLAEAQVRTNGVRWLALKAAATLDAGDAALALLHAQEAARAVTYDLHQFLGAMGMTLEHPLHLWTYRLKALIGELGGRAEQAAAAADAIWG